MRALRQTRESVHLPALVNASTLGAQAREVLRAVAAGELAPDAGAELLGAAESVARVVEVEELATRISKFEEATNGYAEQPN